MKISPPPHPPQNKKKKSFKIRIGEFRNQKIEPFFLGWGGGVLNPFLHVEITIKFFK
jgi:hypothetical protein